MSEKAVSFEDFILQKCITVVINFEYSASIEFIPVCILCLIVFAKNGYLIQLNFEI